MGKAIKHAFGPIYYVRGLPRWHRGKEPACQCRRHKRCEFDPWMAKIPWRRQWLPTQVFLSEEFYGQRILAGYSPWGGKELDLTECACVRAHTHTLLELLDRKAVMSSCLCDLK